MVQQSTFPRTENIPFNKVDGLTSGISTSLELIRIYRPLPNISAYKAVEGQKTRGSRRHNEAVQADTLRQISMLQVRPVDIEQKLSAPSPRNIPEDSPIYSLQFLETGWDGYWAEPLSLEVLFRAEQLWRKIQKITVHPSDLPNVQPAANASVAFTWSNRYPEKELEIWLYDQSDYYAEWMISAEDSDEEDTAQSQTELIKLVKRYQEL